MVDVKNIDIKSISGEIKAYIMGDNKIAFYLNHDLERFFKIT